MEFTSPRFRINAPSVANENMDGEMILIHFDSGTYYSTDPNGTDVLRLIEAGLEMSAIVSRLCEHHEAERDVIETRVVRFVNELEAEGLVVSDSRELSNPQTISEFQSAARPGVFESPILQKYEDLQDILILDPIHEGEDEGWPVARDRDPPADS